MFSIKAGSGWAIFGSGASGILLRGRWRGDAALPRPFADLWEWAPWPVLDGREQALSRLTLCLADIDARDCLRRLLSQDSSRLDLRSMSDAQVLHEAARMLHSGRLSLMRQVLSEEGRRRHKVSPGSPAPAPLMPSSVSRTRPPLTTSAPLSSAPAVTAERESFDHDAQARALIDAARHGRAFCQECARVREDLQAA